MDLENFDYLNIDFIFKIFSLIFFVVVYIGVGLTGTAVYYHLKWFSLPKSNRPLALWGVFIFISLIFFISSLFILISIW